MGREDLTASGEKNVNLIIVKVGNKRNEILKSSMHPLQ